MKVKKRYLIWGIVLIILGAVTFGFIYSINISNQNNEWGDIFSVNLREHVNLALHFHPILQIKILGENVNLPANTGITQQGMKVIHTHDSSGKLHVEAPYPYEFVLGDFFSIWGRRLTRECIFEYCEDESHKLTFLVNGVPNELRNNLVLKDADVIQIRYEEI
tara:strand:- start:1188 stop:1676 length:489 start_codon:yes stop_codon:yes gene_type:complete